MILKFDHISFSCEKQQVQSLPLTAGYELQFREMSLRNLGCKEAFFQKPHTDHDIYMYERKGALPIEITAYDSCFSGVSSMDMENDSILIYSPDPAETADFFMLLGLKSERLDKTAFVLKGSFILGGSITLRILQSGMAGWKLDKAGWSSLGFLSGDSQKELRRMHDAGYEVTDAEELIVNQKAMNIGFCKGPFGEIIEIISLKRSGLK